MFYKVSEQAYHSVISRQKYDEIRKKYGLKLNEIQTNLVETQKKSTGT